MEINKANQFAMHKNYFDKCKFAVDSGFYLEAIFLEYAAIESRLEIICGVLGLPCNKNRDDNVRKSIQISHRISCLNYLRKNHLVFENTKLSMRYFDKLNSWINKRNQLIHGLYKNEIQYKSRIAMCKKLAEDGYEYSRLLYNETKRLRRIHNNHPELLIDIMCHNSKCSEYKENIL